MYYCVECVTLFRECRRHSCNTGALLPSSRFLARALVSEVRKPHLPSRILEVGPGTGAVTAEVLRHVQRDDTLELVEINGQFIDLLQRRFEKEEHFRRHRDQVKVFHAPVEELPGEGIYDYIVSGLPLNNFSGGKVRDIFNSFNRLLKPDGVLTYYEYVLVRQLKMRFVSCQERRRLYQVGRVLYSYIRAHQVRRQRILMNVPPAVVRTLSLKPCLKAVREVQRGRDGTSLTAGRQQPKVWSVLRP